MFDAPDAGLIATSFRSLPAFGLTRAANVQQAVDALAYHENSVVLSGATDLVARFNEGFMPSHVVDVNAVASLKSVVTSDTEVIIGAGVTHHAGSAHDGLRSRLPAFAQAWSRISNVRIRLSATLGGNVMARRTRYEGAILLSALAARLRFVSAEGGFEIPVEGVWDASLPPASLLTHIVMPLRVGLVFDYERSMRPVMTQAIAMDGEGRGRVVTATEYARPQVWDLTSGAIHSGQMPPRVFGDPVASDAYLNKVSRVFVTRQLARVQIR